jgi:hypothetical protein
MTVPVFRHGRKAPQSYWDASPEVRAIVTNGCGPAGWKVKIVPDTVYGRNIKEDCRIHDWMYALGSSDEDKQEADVWFLHNMMVSIKNSWWPLSWLRRVRIQEYYEAVSHFGNDAFWENKIA